jgi:hypothetical protein
MDPTTQKSQTQVQTLALSLLETPAAQELIDEALYEAIKAENKILKESNAEWEKISQKQMCLVCSLSGATGENEKLKAEIEELKYEIYGDDGSDGLKDKLAVAELELKAYSTSTTGGCARDVWEVDHNEWVADTFENLMEKIGMGGSVANDACDFIEKKLEQQDQDLHIGS